MTPQETDSDLPISVQQSLGEVWVAVACCRVGGTECSSAYMGPFEGVAIIFITSTIVWPQVNPQEGNMGPPINRKLD